MSEVVTLFGREFSMPKSHIRGTHRLCSPAETFERLQPVRERVGITRLANVSGLDTIGLPVWVAIRPNSRGLATSQGKGLNHDAAKVSALMESIESWHGENIDLPLRYASAENLSRTENIIDVKGLSFYADSAPRPDTPLTWVEGWDMMSERPCYVPFETVSTDYVVGPGNVHAASFVQSSNGQSGGNHLVEATTHALFEVIERDAVSRAGGLLRTYEAAHSVDPASVTDSDCRKVIDLIEAAGVRVAILELTSDIGVPVFSATIVDGDAALGWRSLPAFNGYGCHARPGIALLRALNEAVQSRLTYISGSRDDISYNEYRRGGNQEELGALRDRLDANPPQRRFEQSRDVCSDSFAGDIAMMLDALRSVGIEQAVVVDLSNPEIGVAVVKVVVPWLGAPVPMIRGREIVVPDRGTLLPVAVQQEDAA